MSLKTTIDDKGNGLYAVAINGRLDTDTAPQLEKQLEGILAGDVRAVRFEMSGLDYLSSMGIRVLFKTFKALKQKKAMFLMANLQPQIKKVIDIAQALPPETIFSSVAEADAYFDAMQKKVLDSGDDDV